MVQRANFINDIWYGINDLHDNIEIMDAFLECHKWLLNNIQNGENDSFYLNGMENIFNQHLQIY